MYDSYLQQTTHNELRIYQLLGFILIDANGNITVTDLGKDIIVKLAEQNNMPDVAYSMAAAFFFKEAC